MSSRIANYKKGAYGRGYTPSRMNYAQKKAYIQNKIAANRIIPVAYPSASYRANRGLKTEVKTVDTNRPIASSLHCSTDATVAQGMQLLNTIPQDSSPTGRIGKKVMMTGVAIRGWILTNTTYTTQKASILLVYVRNNNQAATLPAFTEVLTAQSSNGLTNRDNASKFKILRRWDYAIYGDFDTAPGGNANAFVIEEFIKFKKPLEACWTAAGTAGTIGQFEKGSLILMTVGTTTEASATYAQVECNTRVYFTDA